MRRRALAATLLLVAAAATALALPGPAAAQRSVLIQDLHAVYTVRESGAVEVEERYRVRFNGAWNGLERVLQLRAPAVYGFDDPIGFRIEATTGPDGERRRREVATTDRYTRRIRVYVPDAVDRTATVVIRYTLYNALGFFAADEERGFPALDEFYWQVTGTDWEVPIRRASAEVHVPFTVEVSQAAAYAGVASSGRRVPVEIDGATVQVPDVGPLDPGEGLTVGVGWPAGAVTRDPARIIPHPGSGLDQRSTEPRPGPLAYLPLLLPLVVFWFGYRAWDARGRDPKERAIMARWEPPEGLSPAEAGTLVDHRPDIHDIIATLVELAVKGYVVIEEQEKEGFLQFGTDYVFHLVRPWGEWDDLPRHQHRFLDGLFKSRSDVGGILKEALGFDDDPAADAPPEAVASVRLSDLKNEFYRELPDIKDAILDALVRKGHYLRRPDKVRQLWGAGGVAMMIVGGAGIAAMSGELTSPLMALNLVIAGFVSAIIFVVLARIMPARTEKGARTREAALGFKRFLEKVEDPRYTRMIQSPAQFEEYLPYAMAFQCQEQWARAFDDLLTEPPDWYYGHHGHFHATAFADNMGQMASTAGTTMASSPGGGSGGGGSVGGGGGGGGGGGF